MKQKYKVAVYQGEEIKTYLPSSYQISEGLLILDFTINETSSRTVIIKTFDDATIVTDHSA